MNKLESLIDHFENFPGVGARQAKRFAFHILTLSKAEISDISELIANLQGAVVECHSCHRFFSRHADTNVLCSICDNPNRDHTKLLIVERDSDIQAIERSGVYDGLYFVFGGTIPLLNTPDSNRLRGGALKATVEARIAATDLSEIILGFGVNPDGENTSRYVESLLKESITTHSITISHLGRGLSTGSELEYADPETIKNALRNRS